jgi:hypothetical protein
MLIKMVAIEKVFMLHSGKHFASIANYPQAKNLGIFTDKRICMLKQSLSGSLGMQNHCWKMYQKAGSIIIGLALMLAPVAIRGADGNCLDQEFRGSFARKVVAMVMSAGIAGTSGYALLSRGERDWDLSPLAGTFGSSSLLFASLVPFSCADVRILSDLRVSFGATVVGFTLGSLPTILYQMNKFYLEFWGFNR